MNVCCMLQGPNYVKHYNQCDARCNMRVGVFDMCRM